MKTFDPHKYLQRIKHREEVKLTEAGLRSLHRRQLLTIPFENFDVLLGRPILLDPGSLFDKLVERSRGGYCFELNGLFLKALEHFGFDTRVLLARVHLSGSTVIGRGHQLSLVTINGREWITDVGFGGQNMCEPIPLEIDQVFNLGSQRLRLVKTEPYGVMLQSFDGEIWQNLYSFDMAYAGPGDIKYGNYYTSTHPDSIFAQNRIASLLTREGSITLYNKTLKILEEGAERFIELPDNQGYLETLKLHFGIELDVPYDRLPALPAVAS
ncbi:MAG: arylamine N-acetyltransferase family protein [Desulfocapsaceae bacterium]